MTTPILDADDAVSTAAAFVRALEMTTRDSRGVFADPGDTNAMSVVCYAALDKLDEARVLLAKAAKEARHE